LICGENFKALDYTPPPATSAGYRSPAQGDRMNAFGICSMATIVSGYR
jgi:hypothetical protein